MPLITTIEDLRKLAQKRVPRMFYDYADSGSWTESTYRANETDFARIKFRQRVARNIDERSIRASMIGQDMAMPVALAPTGLAGMQHADGEILTARAAVAFGLRYTLSTMSICSLEDIAEHVGQPFWFQLYVMRDRSFIEQLIERAKAAGVDALVLTLDLQILGQRHKDLINGLSAPPKLTLPNILNMMTKPRWVMGMLGTQRRGFGNIVGHVKGVADMSSLSSWTAQQFDPRLSWDDVAWIKKCWGGKLIIKGILDVEDARLAADCGADALVVSNHGGRQLDGAPSSISQLPAIVEAVGNRIEVWLDGGIRSGQDVLKAMALGAKGTMIGRPHLYGLGAMGEAGVTKALDIIARELDVSMALCGYKDIREVNREILLPGTFPGSTA
ncbi:alpha-hydroxy-acid oxidizing enzyme [Pseudomonas sp. FDAARGOS_380]|uniref:alpha-hydroxy acid oxidase n=1 Tax=unclassified Pseudomonas TaxID=196821 RepID=UPI000BFDE320|nr:MULTISPECIES: alpha-hydroxy acid oxidase [unclassified Pseudomonas]ATN12159.1 alpha-hydroxy-acid oxidizing enzyme [Pseudomonas sp. FDAARGOS_380]NMX30114.1 alpha-hydroxy-acid oxidizing protein [Pseudomonas sp. WS 5406]